MQLSINNWLNFYVNVALNQEYQKMDLPLIKEEYQAKIVLLSLYAQKHKSDFLKHEWIINFKRDPRFKKLIDHILLSFKEKKIFSPFTVNCDGFSSILTKSTEIEDFSLATMPTISEMKTLKELSWGPINRKKVSKLLCDKPIGSWLIRYSTSQNQFVLSYLNQKREVVHYLSKTESGKIYKIVKDFEERFQITLMDSLRLSYHVEPTVFKTFGYQLQFANLKDLNQFQLLCMQYKLEDIQFDRDQRTCLMKYGSFEMLMLCYLDPGFIKFFGMGFKNTFNGYLYKAFPTRLVSEDKEMCLSTSLTQLVKKACQFFREREFKPRSLGLKDFDPVSFILC